MKRFALLLLLVVIGCGERAARGPEEIRVGVYGSLTGTTATFGQHTKEGVELAFEEVNAAGGLLGKKLRMIVEDNQGKPEESQTVVTKLIARDRVIAVIGESASSRSLAAAPVCQRNRIPMISPASTNPRVTQIGDYIFRVCFIDPFQGKVMAKFAGGHLKLKQVAILKDIKNDYSVGLAEVFTQHFTGGGGQIVAEESYSEGDTDFSAQLTSIKSKAPEAIFIPGYYTEVGLIARQARNLGLSVTLLGGDGWESPKLWEIGREALNGSYYSNHYSPEAPNPVLRKFVAAYKERFGQTPDAVSALSYDAGRLLIDAIRRAGSAESSAIRTALAQTKDFDGVTGRITMDADRNPVKPAVVLRVQDGRLEFISSIAP